MKLLFLFILPYVWGSDDVWFPNTDIPGYPRLNEDRMKLRKSDVKHFISVTKNQIDEYISGNITKEMFDVLHDILMWYYNESFRHAEETANMMVIPYIGSYYAGWSCYMRSKDVGLINIDDIFLDNCDSAIFLYNMGIYFRELCPALRHSFELIAPYIPSYIDSECVQCGYSYIA